MIKLLKMLLKDVKEIKGFVLNLNLVMQRIRQTDVSEM